jgi:hypothetical protein
VSPNYALKMSARDRVLLAMLAASALFAAIAYFAHLAWGKWLLAPGAFVMGWAALGVLALRARAAPERGRSASR